MADLTQYVLPFVGTEMGGNVFPGATRPFGMVRVGPDLLSDTVEAYAGYLPVGEFTGFSMMHLSGTGGIPMYGVVSQLPVASEIQNPLDVRVGRADPDSAEVGYYRAKTADEVVVELAATEHAAMYQYTFPADGGNILFDLSHRLRSFRDQGLDQKFDGGNMTIGSDGQYKGSATYSNGYNMAPPWTIYFCGLFDQSPSQSKVFKGTNGESNDLETFEAGSSISSSGARVGAVLTFDSSSVVARVGISFISSSQACNSVRQEIPSTSTLTDIVEESQVEWNEKVLSKVTTTHNDPADLQSLYTSLYVLHQMPSNRTGENPRWESEEPYFDDIFTLWDLFRTSTPLLHILQPEAYEQLIRSLIDGWRNDGYLSNARSVNFDGPVQGGSNSDIVLADAYVKGVKGAINWTDGYAAMLKNAEVAPPNNFDPRANDSSTKEGRGGLSDWLELGFITSAFSRSVSAGIEYAANDFALYQVAQGEADDGDVEKYWRRSQNWRNYWDPDVTSFGYEGFVMPRTRDGFDQLDPLLEGGYWPDPLYQGSSWEYSFNAHHDMAAMVQLCGGSERYISRLQTFFERQLDPEDPKDRIYDPSNQVAFATPYMFHFGARPDLSVSTSREIAREEFAPKPIGLPGNADAGSMQSWLLWNMIGLFPIPGQTTFLIHSPWFEHLRIDLGSGKSLVVNSTDGDRDVDIHVQSLRVNGQEWRKTWLTWSDVFANGGTLEFALGPEPNLNWFDAEDLPPSPASATGPFSPDTVSDVIGADVGDGTSTMLQRDHPARSGSNSNSHRLLPLLSLLVLIVPIITLAFLFWRRRRRNRQNPSPSSPSTLPPAAPNDTLEKGTHTTHHNSESNGGSQIVNNHTSPRQDAGIKAGSGTQVSSSSSSSSLSSIRK